MRIRKYLAEKNSDIMRNGPVKIAFLGDSVTQGCFETIIAHDGSFSGINDYDAVYHNQLRKMLNTVFPDTPINIINAGIGGNSAVQGLERVERDVLAYSPDFAVVCFGLNDNIGGLKKLSIYEEALREIFRKLKAKDIETVFMTPNMMNTYVSTQIDHKILTDFAGDTAYSQMNGVMDSYIEGARKICTEEGIAVCDCYERWKKLFVSGVDITRLLANHINHPSREMHKLFARALFDAIMFS